MCANSKGKIFMSTLSRKLNGLFKENAKLRKRLSEAEAQIWQKEIGNKDVLILLSMQPIENSNLKDWSCIRRINGQVKIRLKEKRFIYVENWVWGTESFKKVAQEIAKKFRIYEEFVAKKQIEPDSWENWWIVLATERESFTSKRQKKTFMENWKWGIDSSWTSSKILPRISFWLRFKTCKMRWMLGTRRKHFTIQKQRAALEYTTFPANPRVYSRKRFWKPTCSRRTILSSLREFTEFGIIFLQIGTA